MAGGSPRGSTEGASANRERLKEQLAKKEEGRRSLLGQPAEKTLWIANPVQGYWKDWSQKALKLQALRQR